MKRGFTLIEMLVVVGILAVLMTVMVRVSSGAIESARATKCIANLKTLAVACSSYADAKMAFPFAGSLVSADYLNNGGPSISYGWVGTGGTETSLSCYVPNSETREDCIRNGQLFPYVNSNRDVFVCPTHKNMYKSNPPAWSYAMNEMFGWDSSGGEVDPTMLMIPKKKIPGVAMGAYNRVFGRMRMQPPALERVLLFAEIQFADAGDSFSGNSGGGSVAETDCTLQYDSLKECIGFNHKSGGNMAAHVAFCDGHVEKYILYRGLSRGDAEILTKGLCTGADITFNGSAYEDMYE